MKKLLLSLAVAATTAFAGMAQTVAFVADGASYSGSGTTNTLATGTVAGQTYTQGDIKIEFVKVNSSSSQVNSKLIRWYANDKIIVTPLNGAVISNVSFSGLASAYQSVSLTCDNGTVTTGATRTWTGSSADALTFTAGAQIRFAALEVTYSVGSVTVKENADLAFAEESVSVNLGETATVAFTKATTAEVSFSNSDATVATYDAATGVITPLAAGTTTITATSPENDDFKAGEATLTIKVVNPDAPAPSTATWVAATAEGNPGNGVVWSGGDIDEYTKWSAAKGSSSSEPAYYNTGSGLRVYKGGTFTLTSTRVIESVTFTFAGKDYTFDTNQSNPATQEINATSYTWTIGQKQCRLQKIEIVYSNAEAKVELPVITFTEENGQNFATITCATEGAEIFYTLDDSEPTASSTKYTAPVKLGMGKVIVKAIAIKDGDKSNVAVASKTISFTLNGSLDALVALTADEITALGGSVDFSFTGKLTYAFQAGNYLYLTDGTNNIKLFGYNTPEYAAGDTFESLTGNYAYRYGQPQVTSFTLSAAVAGGEVIAPEVIADASAITAANDNKWYTIKGVEIKNVNGKNATMVANGTEVALYDDFACTGFAEGTNLTVSGFVGIYNTNIQFLPTEITDAAGEEFVAAPVFSHDSGAYPENTEIQISCATEGATIVYTVNGGEIQESDETVTLTLTEAMSVEAYAKKDGMEDSQTVTAEYTIKVTGVIEGTTAVFDFAPAEFSKIECEPAQSTYPDATLSPLYDYVLTSNGVSLTFDKGSYTGNIDARLFVGTGTNPKHDMRLYNGQTMTVSIAQGYYLKGITFTFDNNKNLVLAEGEPGSFSNGEWTAEEAVESRAENKKVNSVTFEATTGNATINSINVDFAKVSTSIDAIEADENVAPVYYNLQGIRISNPTPGQIVIRRQGKSIEKMVF